MLEAKIVVYVSVDSQKDAEEIASDIEEIFGKSEVHGSAQVEKVYEID